MQLTSNMYINYQSTP